MSEPVTEAMKTKMIDDACRAAWVENCALFAETHPDDHIPLSEGWDKEPEGLRESWRRMMRAAFRAVGGETWALPHPPEEISNG